MNQTDSQLCQGLHLDDLKRRWQPDAQTCRKIDAHGPIVRPRQQPVKGGMSRGAAVSREIGLVEKYEHVSAVAATILNMSGSSPVKVVNANSDGWADIEKLLGRAGASNGCWCQYWLLGADYKRRGRELNRHDLTDQVHRGRAGLVAYLDGEVVGWARFTPRSDLSWLLDRFSKYDFSTEDAWSMSCFFVARSARDQGVMQQLIEFAVDWGRQHDIVIEGYPIDTSVDGATRNTFPGTLQSFLRAGFTEQGRLGRDRAVVTTDKAE